MNKLRFLIFMLLLSFFPLACLAQQRFDFGGKIHYSNISYFNDKENKINGRNEGLLHVEMSSKRESTIKWKAATEFREDL